MPAMAPAGLDAQAAEGKVDLVVYHNQIPRRDAEGLTSRGDTRPAAVHEGLGQEHGGFFADQAADAVKPLVALPLEGDTSAARHANGHHTSDIVTRLGVTLARVAQADDQLQGVSNRD